MKETQIIRKFTIGCYIVLLLFPYCYGTALPQKSPSSPHSVDTLAAPSSRQVTSNPFLHHLSQLIKQGDQYHDHHQYFQSIAIYREALQQYAQKYTKKTLLLAQLYNNMGMSYLSLKDYTQTAFYYHQALTIRQALLKRAISLNNVPLQKSISKITGKSHHNLGILYLELKQHTEAILSFEAALKTQWQYHAEAIDAQYMLANIYQQTQHYQASKALYHAILVKQGESAYLTPETIANVKKHLSKITEKELNIRQDHFSSSPFNMATFPKIAPNLSALCSALPSMRVTKLVQNKNQPSHSPPLKSKKPSFSCDECGKHCQGQYALTTHMRTHTGEKPFACPVCEKKFAVKYNIKSHMRVHTGEKPFICPVCHKKFSQKQYIKTHMRSHTGEKPFSCPICGKKFSRKNNMQRHSLHIHKKINMKKNRAPKASAVGARAEA